MARWLRRFVVLAGFLLFLALAALLWYVYLGGGDEPPPQDEDLIVPEEEVPDSENGYVALREALSRIVVPGLSAGVDWPQPDRPSQAHTPGEAGRGAGGDEAEEEPLNPLQRYHLLVSGREWDGSLAQAVLERNRATFDLVAEAIRKPAFLFPMAPRIEHWPDECVEPTFLWDILSLRARSWLRRGDGGKGLEAALDILRLGKAMEKPGGSPLIVARDFKAMACITLRQFLCEAGLPVDGLVAAAAELLRKRSDPAAIADHLRRRYTQLADWVDEFASGRASLIRSMRSQILSGPATSFDRAGDWLVTGRFPFRPNWTKRIGAEAARHILDSLGRPFPDRKPLPAEPFLPVSLGRLSYFLTPNGTGRLIAGIFTWSADRLLTDALAEDAEIAATAVLLAMRAFQIENGRLPATLDELLPKYLDTVPADPFDGKPLRYSAERKVVYSVGEDLLDSGGTLELPSRGGQRERMVLRHPEKREPSFPVQFGGPGSP